MKYLYSLLRILLLLYLGLMIIGQFFSDGLIYPKPRPSYQTLPGQVSITTEDHLHIIGDWHPSPGARLTVLYAHGNGEDLGLDQTTLQFLSSLGFNVLAYDYRGYGQSEGAPSETGLLIDVQSAYRYLWETQHIPPEQIIVWGRSLGSGSACFLASHQKVGGLVLESAYTSIFQVAVPWLWFPNDQFLNRQWIRDVHCPVLFIHGTEDRVIPLAMGQKLYQMATGPKFYLWVTGAGHNDLLKVAPNDYRHAILSIAKVVEASSSHSTLPP